MMKAKGLMDSLSKIAPTDDDFEGDTEDLSDKLLALQNLLESIKDIAADELKPFIEDAQKSIHMQHEAEEGDKMGVDEAQQDIDLGSPKKGAISVAIGMGKPKGLMADEDDMEDEDEDVEHPKGGFLAILQKKIKKK